MPPVPDAAGDTASPPPPLTLRGAASKAVAWSFIGQAGKQGLRLLFVLFLARLIGPEDFGLTAQAMVFITFVALFLDQGLGATLIQRRVLTDEVVGTVFWLNLAATMAMALLTLLLAPVIAGFFGHQVLTTVIRVLAIDVLFLGIDVVPRAMLSRSLQFRALALCEIGGAAVGGVAGVASALAFPGYWALAVQTIVADVLTALLLLTAAPKTSSFRGSRAALRQVFGYSTRVFGANLLGYAARNLDNVLVGRYLGASPLAFYSLSYRTLMVPILALSQVASRVALPVYSRVHHEPARVRAAYLESNRLIATLSTPLMIGVVVEAPRAVELLFGSAWQPAVVPMQILALTGLRQAVQSTLGPLLLGIDRADLALRWSIGTTILYVTAFAVGLRWGIVGVAAAYTVAGYLAAPVAVIMLGRVIGFTPAHYLRMLVPAVVASAVLGAVALAVELTLSTVTESDLVIVVLSSALGTAGYVGTMRTVWPNELHALAAVFRDGRRRGTSRQAAG